MIRNILIHGKDYQGMADAFRERLPEIRYEGIDHADQLAGVLARFDPEMVVSLRSTPGGFPKDAFFAKDSIKWFVTLGVGVDHLMPWDPKRMTVLNNAGVSGRAMAEYMIMGFLHFAKTMPDFQADQAARSWTWRQTNTLEGKTVAILGLGGTGRETVKLARAFGMRVLGCRGRPTPDPEIERVVGPSDVADILKEADYVAVCVPGTSDTRRMLDAAALAATKKGAVIADVSRGNVIDETALADALRSGHIAGCLRDVFEKEPLPRDHPLWDTPNMIVTPHCSAEVPGWIDRAVRMICDNIERINRGETPVNVCDPARGY